MNYKSLQSTFALAFFSFFMLLISFNASSQISGNKTIGTGGSYSTLTAAISAASSAGINGPLVLELLANYSSSGETFPLTIPLITGASATNTITIRPATGTSGLSIASSNATATIDLNGVNYLIIDGRPGGSGSKSLNITNSSTTGVAIRWINDASNNIVRYSIISGQNTAPTGGVIYFAGTSGSTGNDNNVVDNCDIKDDNGNTPTTSVYGSGNTGSTTLNNSNVSITNCNLINFWNNTSTEVNAFKVSAGNTDWIIKGNSMYQTATRVPTAAFQLYFFNMNNSSANNHVMDNNFCGGTAPQCGGSPFTVNTTIGFRITGGYLSVGATTPSSFSGNTFANFDITSGTSSYTGIPGVFSGPWLVGGLFNVNNNTFGNMNGTSSIKITSSINGNAVFPIGATGTTAGTINIKGNNFGGIEVAGTSASISTSLQCISIASATSTVSYNIDSNIIGNTIPDNLICSTPSNSSTLQIVMGIYNASATPNINARYNIIRNLRNNVIGSTTGISYYTHGIDIGGGGSDTIVGNQIYNLNCGAAYQNNTTGSAAVIGIRHTPTSSGNVVAQNTIYGLNATYNGGATLTNIGIIINGLTNSRVERNFIHSLNASATGTGVGIYGISIQGGTTRVMNNMIRLGIDTSGNSITGTHSFIGVLKSSGNISLLHNSVYLGGTNVGSGINNTYAYSQSAAGSDSIYNNIFSNERSNSTTGGAHYAVNLTATTGSVEDYNLLSAGGTGGSIGLFGSTPALTVGGWASTSGVDANSYNALSGFKVPNGSRATVDLHTNPTTNKGSSNAIVGNDYDGDIRSLPPDVGADEIPYDIGVLTIDSPTNATFCGRSRAVYVKLKNYGLTTVTSAAINVFVNNNLAFSYNWSGNLTPGSQSASVNIGSYTFTGGAYNLSISSLQPNGKTDNNFSNDAATVSFSVTPTVIPGVSISTANTTVCINSPVTFKAAFANGGSTPVFVWKKNGTVVGTNDTVYSSSTLANSDSITVTLTSNATCANPVAVTSNQLKMTVGVTLPPSVTIQANNTTVCPGTSISFTATPVNGGTTPHYAWLKNGVAVGTDSIKFTLSSPTNNDAIKCVMTSNLSCASKPQDTSAATVVTVTPAPLPTAIVTAKATSICNGVSDTFTVAITNGGTNPVYGWRKNAGIPIGSNNATFITSALTNGDSIYLVLNSNAPCANPTSVTSNKIGISVINTVSPTLSITSNKGTICNGDLVTFKSTYSNGGNSPVKNWYRNSSIFNTGVDSVNVTGLTNTDTIYMMLTSNATCVVNPTITSNKLTTIVNPVVTPSISMNASATNICSGTVVAFTATPINGGSAPHFVWLKSGSVVGTDSVKLTTNAMANKDSFSVVLISNAPCATKTNDTSNRVTMSITPTVTPAITVNTNTPAFCTGTSVSFTSIPLNTGTTPHIQWYKNSTTIGTDSSGLTYASFNDKDTVYAILTSSATCATINNVKSNKVILLAYPSVNASVNITESVNNICSGTNVTFTAYPANGGLTPVYAWKVNGNTVGTNAATFASNTLSNNDSVMVFMTSSSNCAVPAIAPSNKIGMTVKPSVTPKLSLSNSENSVCNGSVVTFTATDSFPGTLPTHRWFKNNVSVGSDSLKYTTAIAPTDVIKCVLTSNAACATKTKDTAFVTITVKPLPAKPTITRSRDSLTSSIAPSYQWYFNNNSMSGATNQLLVITQNGTYKVMVDSLGCSNTSNTLTVANLAVKEAVDFGNISLAPNPTQQIILVNAEFNTSAPTQITIMDITGRELMTTDLGNTKTITNHSLDLGKYDDGTYLVFVKHGEQIASHKVMKNE